MSYSSMRFVGEVDEEFICTICISVFEDPVQTPCDHHYCKKCIEDWLFVNATCPLDRQLLTLADLRPASRLIRILIGKLDVFCDFHEHGCPDVIRLDSLQSHRSTCKYNMDGEVECDKGCNLKVTLREYLANDCIAHLRAKITSQKIKIMELKEEVTKERKSKEYEDM